MPRVQVFNRKLTPKEWRVLAGCTQQEVADMMGRSRDYYRNRERYLANFTALEAELLTKFYGISFEEVMWSKIEYENFKKENLESQDGEKGEN